MEMQPVERKREASVTDNMDILVAAANDRSPKVRAAAAYNALATTDLIDDLATDSNSDVRAAAARHANLSHRATNALVKDTPKVREALASNTRLSPPIIAHLAAADESLGVTHAAGTNPSLPPETMEVLSEASPLHRQAIASNPGTPGSLLERLAEDSSPSVRKPAVREIERRIVKTCAVARDNSAAIAALRQGEWWNLNADSDEVVMVKALHRDR